MCPFFIDHPLEQGTRFVVPERPHPGGEFRIAPNGLTFRRKRDGYQIRGGMDVNVKHGDICSYRPENNTIFD
jgi:hypothetical protein